MTGNSALAARTVGVIAVIVAASLALGFLVALLKFERKLLDVTVTRLSLAAEEVRQQSETGLALGLEIDQLQDLAGALSRASGVRDVRRIDVWDQQGKVLFSSDPSIVGSIGDRSGLAAEPGARYMRRVRGDALTLGASLNDGTGRAVGVVVVQAGLAEQQAELDAIRKQLVATAAPLIAIALLLTIVAVSLTIRSSALPLVGGGEGQDGGRSALEARLAAAIAGAERELALAEGPPR